MGDKVVLELDARDVHGKKVKALRKQGILPAVVYGSGVEAQSAQIEEGVFLKAYRKVGRHTPVTIVLGKKKHIALVKDVDTDAVKHRPLHVSFHAVKANEPVVIEVSIRLIGEGESAAEKEGLVILQTLEHIEVRALPMELPEALEISIVDMKEAGDRVTVGDIKLPKGIEIVERNDGRVEDDEEEEKPSIFDLVIASVYEPSALQAANEAAAGDAEDESSVESDKGSDEAGAEEGEDSKAEAKK